MLDFASPDRSPRGFWQGAKAGELAVKILDLFWILDSRFLVQDSGFLHAGRDLSGIKGRGDG